MKALVALLLFALIPVQAQTPRRAVLFDGTYASPLVKIVATTIAGIVNRDSARLFLLNVYEPWSYPAAGAQWRNLYETRGNVTFDVITVDTQLVNRFRPFINGGINFDYTKTLGNFPGQSFYWQGEYAALLGGLTNRIPVNAGLAARYRLTVDDSVLVTDAFDGDSAVWVPGRLDLASLPWNNPTLPSDTARYLTLVDWGIKTLLPRCNPQKFYIREITDFTIQQRMFQVNVAGNPPGGLNFYALTNERAEAVERVMQHLQSKNPASIFHVYGWMDPEPLTQWLATFGASFHETLIGNLSWHSAFPWPKPASYWHSALGAVDTSQALNKYYLLFISSEGDASNWVYGLQSGAWLSPQRGTVPIAWGFNLHLLDLAPFIASYYLETATPNDGIVSVTSPLGYAYPDLWWGLPSWQGAIDSTVALMDRFRVKTVYGYKHYAPGSGYIRYRNTDIYNSFNFGRYGQFQQATGAQLTILYDPQMASRTPVTSYGPLMFNHLGDGSFYGRVDTLTVAAQRILGVLGGMSKPGFLVAGYQRFRQDGFTVSPGEPADISVARLAQLVQLLKADPTLGLSIEVVTPETFTALMRKSIGLTGVGGSSPLPAGFALLQNYPNPFNPQTVVSYQLSVVGRADLRVYDLLGREVAVLVNEEKTPGTYTATWNATGMASGVYFCRLKAGEHVETRRMMLVR